MQISWLSWILFLSLSNYNKRPFSVFWEHPHKTVGQELESCHFSLIRLQTTEAKSSCTTIVEASLGANDINLLSKMLVFLLDFKV